VNLRSLKSLWQERLVEIKIDINTMGYAIRHPRTPWHARLFVALIVAYAISPIDFIPDFIPVLGYLDDIVLIALSAFVAVKLIPPDVWAECRKSVQNPSFPKILYYTGILMILGGWLGTAYFLWLWLH
jgi:uncharacterized membrane protein YkvA (DUF1232 family)